MNVVSLSRCTLGFCAATVALAGCGTFPQAQGDTPIGTIGAMPLSRALVRDATEDRSWMAPDAKNDNLLYVSDLGSNDVYVYSYPRGGLKGMLTGFEGAHGECVDKRGDVFITETRGQQILEYPHGGTSPIATVNDPGYSPLGCAIDSRTGNLAVTNDYTGTGAGNVSIYKHAKGKPKGYTDSTIEFYSYCSYDDKGNLYFDGSDVQGAFKFAELPARSHTFTNITLNQTINEPGGVQWDGNDVAVGDQGMGYSGSTVYEFAISGNSGTLMGTTPLTGSAAVEQFWIQHKRVVGGSHESSVGNVQYWHYPAGGSPTKTIDGLIEPIGAIVSSAK